MKMPDQPTPKSTAVPPAPPGNAEGVPRPPDALVKRVLLGAWGVFLLAVWAVAAGIIWILTFPFKSQNW